MSEYETTSHVTEADGNEKECLRKQVFYLKEALRTMRDYCRDLEQQLYDIQMVEKKEKIKKIPSPDITQVSEFTKTDFLQGRAYDESGAI